MILWIDDDILASLRPFVSELEENGFRILFVKNPDEMWTVLRNKSHNVTGIIMDIMLPTGDSVNSNDSEMGHLTGLVLLKEIKASDALKAIPVLIFTILERQEVFNWAKENKVEIMMKQETLPLELLEKVREIGIEPEK